MLFVLAGCGCGCGRGCPLRLPPLVAAMAVECLD